MPYPGLFFFLAYVIVRDDNIAYEIAALLQILLGSIAILVMTNLCYKICIDLSQSDRFARRASVVYLALSTFFLQSLALDGSIISDGPGASFLSLFVFYYYRYLSVEQKRLTNFALASFSLAMTCLWRPYYILLYITILVFEVYKAKKLFVTSLWQKALLLALPITLLDLPWIIRNYITFGQFIPAQYDIYAGSCDRVCLATREFAKILGASNHLEFKAPFYFRCYLDDDTDSSKCPFRFPWYVLGNKLTIEEIDKAKSLYNRYRKSRRDSILADSVIQAFQKLVSYYRQDHPYLYWLYPRLECLRRFFIHSAAPYSPGFKEGLKKFNKIFFLTVRLSQTLLYWIALIMGVIGLIIITNKKLDNYVLLFIPIYLAFLFPIYLLSEETRYFYAAYPMLFIGVSYQIGCMLNGISLWKLPLLRNLSQKLQ